MRLPSALKQKPSAPPPRVCHSRLDVRSEFLKQQQPVGDYLIRATMQQTHPYSHNSNVQIPL